MAYGAQIWSENGRGWVDVVQPSWVVDMRAGVTGNGSASYPLDPRFHLRVAVLNYIVSRKQGAPTFSISGGTVSWSAPASCTFIVFMEAN